MSNVPNATSTVFVSYSRRNKEFAQKLNASLDSNGVDAWVDWEGIPLSSDWMDEITRAIEGGDAFLFIITPDSLASKVCMEELELGLKYNKKLIPILHIEPEKGSSMHESLGATNWVYMREQDDYEATLPMLIETIHTDLGWVRQHTRLLKRAKEWESKNKNSSFLLQGSDLSEAENWMVEASAHDNREVVPLQGEFIQASRQLATKRQRNVLIGVSLALVVSIGMAIFAMFQRGIAIENENIAIANENARATQQVIAEENEAEALLNEMIANAERNAAEAQRSAAEARIYQNQAGALDTSTLLAIDSWQRLPSAIAEDILRRNTSLIPIPLAQKEHQGRIITMERSPNGKFFATASADNTACVWTMATAEQLFCVEHADSVNDVLFSRDGKILFTASSDGTVGLWDAETGASVRSYDFNGTVIWDVDIRPDGSQLAVARDDSFVSMIDLSDFDKEPKHLEQDGTVYFVTYSPDGEWLGIANSSGKVPIWNIEDFFFLSGAEHSDEVYVAAFSPDSEYLITGGADSTVRLSRTLTGGEVEAVTHGDWVEDLAFSPDGTWYAVASDDNRVWIWDTETGKEKQRMEHDNFVQEVKISTNGEWIASTGSDQTVRIWDSASGSEMMQIPLDARGSAVLFSEDGTHLVVGDYDGNLALWDISYLLTRLHSVEFSELVREAHFSPSGEWLIANTDARDVWMMPTDSLNDISNGSEGTKIISANGLTYDLAISADSEWVAAVEKSEKRVILYNVDEKTSTSLWHQTQVNDVAFHPDGTQIATASDDGQILIWDVKSASELASIEFPAAALSVTYQPDGAQIAIGFADHSIIWGLASDTSVADLAQTGEIQNLAYSPDGNWLATASLEGTVQLWSTQNSYNNAPIELRISGQPQALEFSPDSQLLAAGGSNNFAYLWDVALGEEVSRLPHSDVVRSVSFSPDGNTLVTVARKVTQFWDIPALPIVPVDELIETACSHLITNLSQSEWETIYADDEYQLLCPDLAIKD